MRLHHGGQCNETKLEVNDPYAQRDVLSRSAGENFPSSEGDDAADIETRTSIETTDVASTSGSPSEADGPTSSEATPEAASEVSSDAPADASPTSEGGSAPVTSSESSPDISSGAPSEAASEAVSEASSEAASETPTEAAAEASTEAASEASSDAAAEASTEAASEASSDAAAEASTEAASEASSDAAAEASTEAASEASNGAAAEASTEAASEASSDAASEASTEAASEASTEAEATSEASSDAASEAAPEVSSEASAEPSSEAAPETPAETTSVPEASSEATAEASSEATTGEVSSESTTEVSSEALPEGSSETTAEVSSETASEAPSESDSSPADDPTEAPQGTPPESNAEVGSEAPEAPLESSSEPSAESLPAENPEASTGISSPDAASEPSEEAAATSSTIMDEKSSIEDNSPSQTPESTTGMTPDATKARDEPIYTRLRFDANYDSKVADHEDKFKKHLIAQIAKRFRIPTECITNAKVYEGSIRFDFVLTPTTTEDIEYDRPMLLSVRDELMNSARENRFNLTDLDGAVLTFITTPSELERQMKYYSRNFMGMLVAIIICGLALFMMFVIIGILIRRLGEANKMNANKKSPISEQESELLMDRWSRMKRAVSITSVKDLNNLIMGKMPRNKTTDSSVFKRRDDAPTPTAAVTRLPVTKSPIAVADRRPISALRVVNEDDELCTGENGRLVITSRGSIDDSAKSVSIEVPDGVNPFCSRPISSMSRRPTSSMVIQSRLKTTNSRHS
ncbi:polysialoglycoprotein-like [Galendromus occidentalis]|uniref:Polysialoglycoprotein-like n=1 Tax=Galendromus occidentalis TaxID=34638 RepID=A0AAJ7SER2_9ACAR|nr:polysialoglycoprotein-like [Galendromus occidentalis]